MRPYFRTFSDSQVAPSALPAGSTTYFARFDSDFLGSSREDSEYEYDEENDVQIELIQSDWPGFTNGTTALQANGSVGTGPVAEYWARLFRGDNDGSANAFEGLRLASLSLPRRRAIEWFEISGDRWFVVDLARYDDPESAGRLSLALLEDTDLELQASLSDAVVPEETQIALDNMFEMTNWPTARARQIEEAFVNVKAASQMIALDVGQGSACAFVASSGTPQFYVDTGAGIKPNARTTPSGLAFCVCDDPPVVLTHWDGDHWSGALHDPSLMLRTWIVPQQKRIKPSHVVFANDLLLAGGRILLAAPSSHFRVHLVATYNWAWPMTAIQQTVELVSCTGTTMNDSGLAVFVSDHPRRLQWLAAGDASYDHVPGSRFKYPLVGLTASHHGAKQPRKRITAPARGSHTYARILYSFGANNRFAGRTNVHPTAESIQLHDRAGWIAGAGLGPGHDPSGGNTLTTAFHAPTTIRGPIAVGWRRPPHQPRHLAACVPMPRVRT